MDSWVRKICWRRDRLPSPLFFPGGSAGEEYVCNVGNLGSVPGLGRSPREGKGYAVQHSGLENSMDCISPCGSKKLDTTEQLSLHIVLTFLTSHCTLASLFSAFLLECSSLKVETCPAQLLGALSGTWHSWHSTEL